MGIQVPDVRPEGRRREQVDRGRSLETQWRLHRPFERQDHVAVKPCRAGVRLKSTVGRPRRVSETNLRVHVLPTFGDRPIGSIRPSEVQAWVRGLFRCARTVDGAGRLPPGHRGFRGRAR